jgi:5-methylcytosine-specific restriction endonuclease McrA
VKTCTHCKETKPLDEFTKHPHTRDGRGSWCKPCTCEAARKIREERPEQVRAGLADYARRNQERLKAYRRTHYEANREQLMADERRRRAARKAAGLKEQRSKEGWERRKIRIREWARLNAEYLKAYQREYYVLQPGRVRSYHHKRRALIQGNGGSYTNEEWLSLCAAYDNRCLRCGEIRPLTIDHVKPLSMGGPNTIENIQPLCKSCNSSKRKNWIDYRKLVQVSLC